MVNDRTLPSSRALRIAGGIEYSRYGIDSYYWRLVLRRPDSPVCRELYALGGFYLPFLTSFHLDYTACGCAIEVEIIVFRPIASHGIARKLPAEWPAPAGRFLIPTEVGTFVDESKVPYLLAFFCYLFSL